MIAALMTTPDLCDLSQLAAGTSAVLERISADEPIAKRLADMGFVRGAVVVKLRAGKPCLVQVGSTCVGLGLSLQTSILVSVPAAAGAT